MPTLLDRSFAELQLQAARIRQQAHGNRITYSPKVFVPLTQLCRDHCGYCTFAKAPRNLASPYLELDEVLAIAASGAKAGCKEVLLTLGESPESRYPAAAEWLSSRGYRTTIDYLVEAARLITKETGLLCHSNAGAIGAEELDRLRKVTASQGMMLESLRPDLVAHRGSPDKSPERRLATLTAAGELHIPFTTGILVGIGEQREDRVVALEAIAELHRRYGHIQEVIVQNFLPKPGTAMQNHPACPSSELAWTIAVARIILPPEVHVQAPPNLSDDLNPLLDSGLDDWGGVSPVTVDHINPERPWPAMEILRAVTEGAGFTLAPRLTIYPEFALDPEQWLDPEMRFYVLDLSDAEGLAREDPWSPGVDHDPPALIPIEEKSEQRYLEAISRGPSRPSANGAIKMRGRVAEVLQGVLAGQEVDEDEIVTLFSARGPEVRAVAELADQLRRETVGDTVTWVANRNINYTNICTFKCRFCAFSKGPLSLNLRGNPYLMDLEEITRRVVEAEELGATEVCLQGGIHPDFDASYYIEILRAVRQGSQRIHIHGFTALEVYEAARRSGISLEEYLRTLKAEGLRTLPGTAAEILDDEIRAILCPDKVTTEQWLEVHRVAHSIGLNSNVTIMFGAVETPRSWARHLVRTRELQKQTGGFTELVPLPYVHMAAPLYLSKRSRRGPTFREALLMHAVGRITYHNWIPNIQVSWPKMGVKGVQQILRAGANDIGGSLIDENISRAAGARHGQAMDEEGFRAIVEPLGRSLEQRTTLYGRVVSTVT